VKPNSAGPPPLTAAWVFTRRLTGGPTSPRTTRTLNRSHHSTVRETFHVMCMEAVQQAQAASVEITGTTQVTAGTMEDMYERAEFAKQLGFRHHHDRPRESCYPKKPAIQSDGEMGAAQRHDPASARAGAPTYTSSAITAFSFRSIAKWIRLGRRRITSMPATGFLHCWKAIPRPQLGYYEYLPDEFNPAKLEHVCFLFDQKLGQPHKLSRWRPGGSHPARFNQLLDALGEDVVLQFGGCTPHRSSHGPFIGLRTANRVAREAMILARNEGRDYLHEGPEILRPMRRRPVPPLKSALEVWKTSLQLRNPPTLPGLLYAPTQSHVPDCKSRIMRVTRGCLVIHARSHRRADLPQVRICSARLGGEHRIHRRPLLPPAAPPQQFLGDVGPADVSISAMQQAC